MTDIEELTNAAEMLKKHCKEHSGFGCMCGMTGCLFHNVCDNYFHSWYGVGDAMADIIHDMRYSDDETIG